MTISKHYLDLVASGKITEDHAQHVIVEALANAQAMLRTLQTAKQWWRSRTTRLKRSNFPYRGVYLYGEVGRGKTLLMDALFESSTGIPKRRVHFHRFMQEVHQWLFLWRGKPHRGRPVENPLALYAKEIAREIEMLCLDELQILDIADAMIVGKLFRALAEHGVWIMTTSNREPEALYKDGIQRESFLPFIDFLREEFWVQSLQGKIDYRLERVRALSTTYVTPLGKESEKWAEETFAALTDHRAPEPLSISVQGREWNIPNYAAHTAWMRFEDLCMKPLGAADYEALAEQCTALLLTNIPKLSPEQRNEAKRFTTLIDILYDHKTILLCTAETAPHALYTEGPGSFEFARTASRLIEMQSKEWGRQDARARTLSPLTPSPSL